ncbi:BamA/TamA family outer membrane protein [Echinicola salinicaeni]|uniref:BamA/TamA family outer membrane protein n=1 Tax=Echinicola salinicaeni TaxID=2762757 RepID=UPI0016481CE4|nr:BamA/TamA family outer membrane protein [Echinicola salinicaeni]
MEARQIKKDSLISAGKPFLSVFAGPGYTPEAGLLIGGGLLYTFTTDPKQPDLQRSSIPLLGMISSRGNIGLSSTINTFWLGDRLRVKLITKVSNVNDDYFGIGYETNSSLSRGKETTAYNRVYFQFQPRVDFRILPHLYLGLSYLYSSFNVKETNPIMNEDPNYLAFGPKIKESGLVYSLTYDSRDVVVNAYKGFYAAISYYNSSKHLGGNQDFDVMDMDLRYYKTINRPGNTLAFRWYGRRAYGEVPYSAMTLIGDTSILRGYLNGQYRDKAGVAMVGEWRYMFLDKTGNKSKHGISTWLGAGTVANDLGELEHWLPNLGLGYRLELQPRMNLRVDFGLGKKSSGLYFNFSEAF